MEEVVFKFIHTHAVLLTCQFRFGRLPKVDDLRWSVILLSTNGRREIRYTAIILQDAERIYIEAPILSRPESGGNGKGQLL